MEEIKERSVFISYSWTTEEHKTWVRRLAERLIDNGIEVTLDQWDLKPGHDRFSFMESMVQDENINKVLIICDKKYGEKANDREGGVGTETQIITPEVYGKVTQEKFIPIVIEQGGKFDSYVPTYLKTRIAIDMSSEEVFEESYEQLLRLIYDKPQFKKPTKGKIPSFLLEEGKPRFKTGDLVTQLKHFLINKPDQADYAITDFIDEFLLSLNQFEIKSEDFKEPYDEQIYSNIDNMLELRNDYINFLTLLCKLKKDFDIELIINLFENLYSFIEYQGNSSYKTIQMDHYKFFIMELFLYTSIILIENEQFEKLNSLLSTKYFVKSKFYDGRGGVLFSNFRFYIDSLDELRNSRMRLNLYSLTANTLVKRTKINNKDYKKQLVDTDLLLHYISSIKHKDDSGRYWFPVTYVYLEHSYSIDFIQKLARKSHFEKVKKLFNVNSLEEMKKLVEIYETPYKGFNNSFSSIPNIKNYIKVDEIAKY